jgi:hypothetical protein
MWATLLRCPSCPQPCRRVGQSCLRATPPSASCRQAPDVGAWYCTTRQHNTHRIEEREVLYPWHPWFGRVVFVHETMKRGGVGVLRCSQSGEEGARCLETPEWMFDRGVCCGMVRGDSPRVSRAALYSLKALISGGFGGSSGGQNADGLFTYCVAMPLPQNRGSAGRFRASAL